MRSAASSQWRAARRRRTESSAPSNRPDANRPIWNYRHLKNIRPAKRLYKTPDSGAPYPHSRHSLAAQRYSMDWAPGVTGIRSVALAALSAILNTFGTQLPRRAHIKSTSSGGFGAPHIEHSTPRIEVRPVALLSRSASLRIASRGLEPSECRCAIALSARHSATFHGDNRPVSIVASRTNGA